MTSREDASILLSLDGDAIFLDGYDDCIIGAVDGFAIHSVVAYDLRKIIAKLKLGGLTEEEAWEWWNFNMIGAYVGDYTPVYVTLLEEEDERPEQGGDSRDVQREDER